MFRVNGIFSNLDVNAMVKTLVDAQRAPAESRYARREQAYNVELSSLGRLQSALATFQTEIKKIDTLGEFSFYKGKTSSDALTLTTTGDSIVGSYQMTVEQLASRHQLASGLVSKTETLGSGSINLRADGKSFTVDVTEASLEKIKDAINQADENTGIQASIINSAEGQRLLLTAKKSGASQAISADFINLSGGTATPGILSEIRPAVNAVIKLGAGNSAITVESATNRVENLIEGTTLELNRVTSGPIEIEINLDEQQAESSLQSFVDAWNQMKSVFDSLTDFNGETAGPLTGDTQVRALERQLRTTLGVTFVDSDDVIRTLGDLGLKTTGSGGLELDKGRLAQALAGDFDRVAEIIAGDNGLIGQLKNRLDPQLGRNGAIEARESRINDALKEIKDDRTRLDSRMRRVRSQYRAQFLAMEKLLASLNGTSTWLTNNLTNNQKG